MPKNRKYHPDYRALYPGVSIAPAVLAALNRSDRKIEYIEYELKHPRVRRNRRSEIVSVTPPREYSLEQLQARNEQFMGTALSAEEAFFAAERRRELRRCLALLTRHERTLIEALYCDDLTERELAAQTSRTQQSINERKLRIIAKLKNSL